jgi:benzoyl-CoA reductase/2-hydroxyglutaryl-CoA dehydratase subunit BcrC/BadD/HgdB
MDLEKHLLGWLCSYTPEEIIIASGFTPVRIGGCEEQAPEQATLLPANMCPYVRSVLDQAIRGQTEQFAGVSMVASCDSMRRLADVWRKAFPETPVHVIDFPRRTGESAQSYLLSQYEAFRDWLGTISGKRAGEAELREAVGKINQKRTILGELSHLRMEEPPGILGSTFFKAASLAFKVPFEEFSKEYTSFFPEQTRGGPRLVITGSITESTRLYETIEEAGANVVAEDLCTGLRSIEGKVEEGDDPMAAIVKRYLSRPPCSRMSDIEGRAEYIKRLLQEYRAQGVVYHCLKFCDQYQYDYPILKARLGQEGIPMLRIESEYQEGDRGQLSTRIEAFIELLGGNVRQVM